MKTVFIDRDGVINKDPGGFTEHGYVTKWEDFHFIPGSLSALKTLKENNIDVMLISNQAGVGKGCFTKNDLEAVSSNMLKEVEKAGGRIKGVFYCIHKKEDECVCRKPKAGLFFQAVKKYGIDAKGAYFIGDSLTDVLAGKAAGLGTILVLSGKASREEARQWPQKPDHIFDDLAEAAGWLIEKER